MVKVYECNQCFKKFVQQKWVCPSCKNTEFRLTNTSDEGTVFSYTTIHVSSKELSHLTPYTIALIELPKGLRLTGRVMGKVNINDRVKCVSYEDNLYVFAKNS